MKLKVQGRYVLATVCLLLVMFAVSLLTHFLVSQQQSRQLSSELTKHTTQSLREQLEKRAESIAEHLASTVFNALYRSNPEEAFIAIQSALSLGEVAGVYIVDVDGTIFHDGTEEILDFGRRYHDKGGLETVINNGEAYKHAEADRFIIGKPIRAGDELIGGLFIDFWMIESRRDIEQMSDLISSVHSHSFQKAQITIALSALLLLVLGVILAEWIARSMSQPLQKLIEQSERLGRGDFEPVHSIERQDEIGELARAFNSMGQKLQLRTEQISHQAYHDALTGLPNRERFIEHIDQLIEVNPNGRFAVMFIDLDEFKRVNDNFGHKAGDILLCELTNRMNHKLRPSDLIGLTGHESEKDVMARIGGDEFLICLPNVSKQEEISRVVDRIFEAIREPVSIGAEYTVIGGSIGVACYPDAGACADDLIKNADIAMYDAKASGKNTFSIFSVQMNDKLEKRTDIERELRKALDEPEQFELWYQPQINLETNQLIGAEGLVRWRHPKRGLISPDEFISIAEETGLIIPIGECLINRLCSQLKDWGSMLPADFHVSLNLSAKQIYHYDLVSVFTKFFEKYETPAERIHIEITESLLMYDESGAQEMLEALRKLGIQVWLDDFGTGFSSLSYLSRFQFDGLKIDRSFIAGLESNSHDLALTAAIISMANSLKMPVIAEGVEEKTQVELLMNHDCELGQGFLFSKPLQPPEFAFQYLGRTVKEVTFQ